MQKNTFHLISLGCAKNTVDSNTVANILQNAGYTFNIDPKQSEYLIVNTCGFIQSARDEAVETLQGLAADKKPGQFLLAIGCMAELYSRQILELVPK